MSRQPIHKYSPGLTPHKKTQMELLWPGKSCSSFLSTDKTGAEAWPNVSLTPVQLSTNNIKCIKQHLSDVESCSSCFFTSPVISSVFTPKFAKFNYLSSNINLTWFAESVPDRGFRNRESSVIIQTRTWVCLLTDWCSTENVARTTYNFVDCGRTSNLRYLQWDNQQTLPQSGLKCQKNTQKNLHLSVFDLYALNTMIFIHI